MEPPQRSVLRGRPHLHVGHGGGRFRKCAFLSHLQKLDARLGMNKHFKQYLTSKLASTARVYETKMEFQLQQRQQRKTICLLEKCLPQEACSTIFTQKEAGQSSSFLIWIKGESTGVQPYGSLTSLGDTAPILPLYPNTTEPFPHWPRYWGSHFPIPLWFAPLFPLLAHTLYSGFRVCPSVHLELTGTLHSAQQTRCTQDAKPASPAMYLQDEFV